MAFEGQPRLRNACDTCHQLKKKCSGTVPCENCSLSNPPHHCFYSPTNRLGRPRGSKNRRKTSPCPDLGSSQAKALQKRSAMQQRRHQLTAAPPIMPDPSRLPLRRPPQRQQGGQRPGRPEFASRLDSESGPGQDADGTDWDQFDLEMTSFEPNASLTMDPYRPQGPGHSSPEPSDNGSFAMESRCFTDHDLGAALGDDLNSTMSSRPAFPVMRSHSYPRVNPSSWWTPIPSMTTHSLPPISLPTSVVDNQYREESLNPTSRAYSPMSSLTAGALSYEQLRQGFHHQAVPDSITRTYADRRTTDNNRNSSSSSSSSSGHKRKGLSSRTAPSCHCTPGLRNLLAILKQPGVAGPSSSSTGLRTPHSSEQQPYPVDTVFSNATWALEQWTALAACPRCSTSEDQQVEEVFLLAVLSVRCMLGQLRDVPIFPSSSSPHSIPFAQEANSTPTARRAGTTRRDGGIGGGGVDKRMWWLRGECPPTSPISDEPHYANQQQQQQQHDDANTDATGCPRVRVGGFDVTGPDRAVVLGVLRRATARKIVEAVEAMRETLRGKMQEGAANDDGSESLLAHIDVMFEDLVLAITAMQ